MTSERVQRQVDRLLDEAEAAITALQWGIVRDRAMAVLALDGDNGDAQAYLSSAQQQLATTNDKPNSSVDSGAAPESESVQPTSFISGRYQVRRFLGEGGKKKVYLAHDATLDRDVAFALIKTEGLDEIARQRITNEAQAMGRLGDHPNIVTVFDVGQMEDGQPYMVLPLMAGGDVEGLIEKAAEHKLAVELVLQIGREVCQGLEFAHEKNIVHRDLKPGNVWLTGDPAASRRSSARGVAKIGDFGLAVAVDRSRLTQAGMMIGTVSYMPPEQAVGGNVTPRSDLYSLGAMLYEMVCGRPPFVGDDSVAIISQHLNTPPVAPSWHRPDCPAGLEALILRLLEKDASKRPGSAAEVRDAIQAVASAPSGSSTSMPKGAEPERSPDPLYRSSFVGREQELRQLQTAFDAALSGQGSLTMVVGEPGIGKTALCEQLATYVTLRGGRALIGHCYEEGSLSLPYLAFVEALRTYVLARDPAGLKSDLGSNGPEVARIVSEVRERANVEPRPAGGDPEEERWHLLQAVTGFLRNASTVQPLLIVLEDLHWADRGTLDLLLHVARSLEGARLLIVGTYRDVEVDRAHPLSATLAELRRVGSLPRVLLRGLTVDEVHRMYGFIRGQEVSWAQAEAVHRQTEGNPLFVQEVLRYLVEEGLVVREAGHYVLAEGTTAGTGIPEGLRDVVGRRLNRLSEKTNHVLSIAAVMGRDFRLDVLQQVLNLPEEEVYAALEEATDRAVVEQRQVLGALAFRFTHAFFRQTLYEEMFAPRRIRLHQQVGRALEAVYARRLEEHAAELAEHFAQSTEAEDLQKALHYCELAAQRAMTVFAYSEAVRHLEQAMRALEVLDPDDKATRCDLLLALGEALMRVGEPLRAATEVEEEIFDLATALGDADRAGRACQTALDGLYRYAGVGVNSIPAWRTWTERSDRLGKPGSLLRVYAEMAKAQMLGGGDQTSGVEFATALQLARESGDNEAVFRCGAMSLVGGSASLPEWQDALALSEELSRRPRDGVRANTLAQALGHCASYFLGWGDRAQAEEMWRDIGELAQRTHDPYVSLRPMINGITLHTLDGRLEAASDSADRLAAAGEQSGSAVLGEVAAASLAVRVRLYLGTADSLLGSLTGRASQGRGALIHAHSGRVAEAQKVVEGLVQNLQAQPDPRSTQIGLTPALSTLEIALLCEDHSSVSVLAEFLAPMAPLINSRARDLTCVARHLGAAAAFLGKPAEARAYYDQALEVCTKVRFRPEIALTRLQLAELLLEHYPDERDTAIEHLDFAIAEFREMKMQPSLERALGHREPLKA